MNPWCDYDDDAEALAMTRGRGAYPIDPLDTRSSGAVKLPTNGQPISLLRGQRPAGLCGMACVHISTEVEREGTIDANDNAMPVLDVTWGKGAGGGKARVDCTKGSVFTVAGAQSLDINASLVSQTDGVALVDEPRVRIVSCTVEWCGGISPKAAYHTTPRVATTAGVFVPIRIPDGAQSLIVLPSVDTTVVCELRRSSSRASANNFVGRVTDCALTGVPIVGGAEWVFLAPVATADLTAVWELWL